MFNTIIKERPPAEAQDGRVPSGFQQPLATAVLLGKKDECWHAVQNAQSEQVSSQVGS